MIVEQTDADTASALELLAMQLEGRADRGENLSATVSTSAAASALS